METLCSVSSNKPNIFYSVKARSSSIGDDLGFITSDLQVIVYCANLYIHFMTVLGYYPLGAEQVRLYGMYHAKTDDYVIMKSLADPNRVVRVVFALV